MGSSDEWSEFQEIIDSTPELDMCVDPRVYGGGNRYIQTFSTIQETMDVLDTGYFYLYIIINRPVLRNGPQRGDSVILYIVAIQVTLTNTVKKNCVKKQE